MLTDTMIPLLDDPRWYEYTGSGGARARPDVEPTGTTNVTDRTNLASPAVRSAEQIRAANRAALLGTSIRSTAPVVQPEVQPTRGTRPVPPPNITAVPEPKVPPVPKYPDGFVSVRRPSISGAQQGKTLIAKYANGTKAGGEIVNMKLDEPPTVAKSRAGLMNYGTVALVLGVGAFALFKFA